MGRVPKTNLRVFLLAQDPAWLVDELLRIANADPLVTARLQAAAGADRSGLVDLSGLRQDLSEAIRPGWYVDYHAVAGYAYGIDKVLDQVDDLIDAGFPEAAIDAAEDALTLLESALEHIDDSDGEVGSLVGRVQEIHLAACEAAEPDPVALGERLARWALRSQWDVFSDAVTAYADVLGEPGLARFEEIVDEQWSKLPAYKPGQDKPLETSRFRPTHLKEALAARRGPDALVEVISHDLASPYQFWRAAQVLAEAGRIDDALGWLERGQEAYTDTHDGRLMELAASLHARAGRPEVAADIAWQQFARRPALTGYQRLQEYATAAGTWMQRRDDALAHLRAQPTVDAPKARPTWGEPPGHSTLVQVLMWEGDPEGAWRAAQVGGCTRSLWLELARARAGKHPADAMPILHREVLIAIEGAKRPAYQAAARLAKELRGYAEQAGKLDEFNVWIRQIRAENKRRHALQDEFSIAGLPH